YQGLPVVEETEDLFHKVFLKDSIEKEETVSLETLLENLLSEISDIRELAVKVLFKILSTLYRKWRTSEAAQFELTKKHFMLCFGFLYKCIVEEWNRSCDTDEEEGDQEQSEENCPVDTLNRSPDRMEEELDQEHPQNKGIVEKLNCSPDRMEEEEYQEQPKETLNRPPIKDRNKQRQQQFMMHDAPDRDEEDEGRRKRKKTK
ncbi:hypothetical protein Ciccas_012367, partial [Cichlidogyrus casuarinus]